MRIQNTLGRVMWLVALLAVVGVLAGCGNVGTAVNEPSAAPRAWPTGAPLPAATATAAPAPTATTPAAPTVVLSPAEQVNVLARRAVVALRDQHLETVAEMVHPEAELTFSPEAFIDPADLQFSPDEVAGLMADGNVYTWGSEAGSGAPITANFAGYYQRYVYDRDYAAAPRVSVGQRIGGAGGTIDNTAEYWPGSMFVEYYFPGSEQYGGMDWSSLRLVFQEIEGQWFLVGVVHDKWTP